MTIYETIYIDQHEMSVEEQFIEEEEYQQIRIDLENALNSLTNIQRKAIHLYFVEQRSYHEICRLLGVKYQSLKNIIHMVLSQIREEFTV